MARTASLILLLLLLLRLPGAHAQADEGGPCRAAIAVAEREHGIPAGLLQAIGRVESGRRDPASGRFAPWPWTINAEGRGMFFPTREAAIAEVRQLQLGGMRSIDIGCLQVNLRHHPDAFASLEQAFDPLANARYAARFLADLHASRQDWPRAAAHYHSQTPERAEAYRARVMAAWAGEQDRTPGAPAPAAALVARFGPATGPASLTNRSEQAQVLPPARPGRGLDAYRAAPITMVGRPASQPASQAVGRVTPFAFFRRPG